MFCKTIGTGVNGNGIAMNVPPAVNAAKRAIRLTLTRERLSPNRELAPPLETDSLLVSDLSFINSKSTRRKTCRQPASPPFIWFVELTDRKI
jgi:hypothetical protein